ncbi:MAG: glycosyltransferase family 39 protein [Thermoanaerobaculia bacterium]
MSQRTAIFLVTWMVAVGYLALRADRGWIPHDEGSLAQTAERVLQGELPHRDFDDPYTGGLAFLHALALRLFGLRLTSLRWMLLIFAAALVPALYAVARRATGPLVAGAVTWTAIAWSLPLYFAGLSSWYNLFFATFGTLALLRHLDSGRRGWLFAAGICGGLSILIKSIGLYYVAAALLFLVYREQSLGTENESPRSDKGYRVVVAASLIVFCTLVAALVDRSPGAMSVLHFLVPVVALCGVLLWNESRRQRERSELRWRRLLWLTAPFAAGVALPILIFLVPYVRSGSVGELLFGVFVLPQKRFQFTAMSLPPPATLVTALPVAAVFSIPFFVRRIPERLWTAVLAAGALLVLAFGDHELIHRGVWTSVRPLVPLAVLAGCVVLVLGGRGFPGRTTSRGAQSLIPGCGVEEGREGAPSPVAGEGRGRPAQGEGLFLLLAMASLLSLVQIPDAFALYFGYAAPIAILALLFVASAQPRAPRRLHLVVLSFYLAFAVTWLHGSLPEAMGTRYWPVRLDTRLDVERGGLRMPERMAGVYRRMVEEVQAHSADGAFIYATPDCPEVYFLTGRRNPTRTIFDFFEDDFDDPAARSRRLLAMLENQDVEVVVLKNDTQFSGAVPEILAGAIAIRYPGRAEIYPYTIHWRSPAVTQPESESLRKSTR